MAEQPPRRGGRLPEGGRTLPGGTTVEVTERGPRVVTPARGASGQLEVRNTSPMNTVATVGDEERTKALGAAEAKAKFADPSDPRLSTQVNKRPVGTTLRDSHLQRDAADRLLPDARDVESVRSSAHRFASTPDLHVRDTLAIGQLSDKLTPEPRPPAQEKTKIWVATHKPPADPDARLILLREPDSERAASFRVLRHRLQQQGDPRVIVVTSPNEDEGKSTCAVNLAMALGECGRAKVLLIEANLRSPSLAALFGFLPPACFSTQLTAHRERPLDPWSVVEAFSPSLHVLAVKPGQESRPLLDGPAFAQAIAQLRNVDYDYLVIDTPPVLGSADVNLVEDCADGVLLTSWSRKTSGRALRRAVEQLAPSKILGITLLDV